MLDLRQNFLLSLIHKQSEKKGVRRKETWEFPILVLREALVNMIVHRDYRQGIKSTIEVRPSFILFSNLAHLFTPTITIERLKTVHPSRPGNRLIAHIFYLMGFLRIGAGVRLKSFQKQFKVEKSLPNFRLRVGCFVWNYIDRRRHEVRFDWLWLLGAQYCP